MRRFSKTGSVSLILLLALALGACGQSGHGNDGGTDGSDGGPQLSDQRQWVLGSVLGDDLIPIAGALLRLDALEATSDAAGRFGFETRAGLGARSISVRAAGFLPAERQVPAGGPARVELGAVILHPAGASASIDGARGGQLIDETAGVEISVPAGAFSGSVDLSTARIPLGDPLREDSLLPAPLPRPAGGAIAGLFALQIDAGGVQPSRPLVVRVRIGADLPAATQVPLGRFDPEAGAWVDLGLATVASDAWLEFETTHLSTFAAALPALPADDQAVAPDLSGLERASSLFKPGEPRIEPRSGALQVGFPLPPLIRAGKRLSLALFHDSRTVQPRLAVPVVAPGAKSGDAFIARVHTDARIQSTGVQVLEDAGPDAAPAVVVDVTPLPLPQSLAQDLDPEHAALTWISSGTHFVQVALEQSAEGLLTESSSASFSRPEIGSRLSTDQGAAIAAPAPVRLGSSQPVAIPVDNRNESSFGAGWNLTGLTRLLQPFCSATRATVVGETEQPAISYGELGDLVSSPLAEQLVAAGLERTDLRQVHVAVSGAAVYVSVAAIGRVYRLDPAGGPAVLVAGGGVLTDPPGEGPGPDVNLGRVETIAVGPLGAGLLIVTPSYISLLDEDGSLIRVVGTGAATGQDDIRNDQPALQSTFANDLAPSVAADPGSDRFVFAKLGDGAFEVQAGTLRRLRLRVGSPHWHNFAFDSKGGLTYSAELGNCIYTHVDGLTDPELFPRCVSEPGAELADGPAAEAMAGAARALAFDPQDRLWFVDAAFGVLRRYEVEGELSTLSAQPPPGLANMPTSSGALPETQLGYVDSLAIRDPLHLWLGGDLPEDLIGLGPAVPGILTSLAAGDGSLLRQNEDGGWLRVRADGQQERYDARGLLTSRGMPGEPPLDYVYAGDWSVPQDDEICGLPVNPPLLDRIELAGETLWSFDYQNGMLRTVTDAAGRSIGRVSSTGMDRFDLPGFSIEFRYDGDGRVIDQRKPDAQGSLVTWLFGYEAGRLISTQQPGRAAQIVESAEGAVAADGAEADAAGVLPSVDARVPVAQLPTRTGQAASVTLGTHGLQVTSPAGDQTDLETDRFGRLLRVRHPDGSMLRLGRDEAGRLTSVCNETTGDCYSYRFGPPAGLADDPYADQHLVERIDPAGRSTRFEYDGDGSLVARTDPGGGIVRFDNESAGAARGLPKVVTDALGRRTLIEYDAAGNLSRLTQQGSDAGATGSLVTAIERDGAGFVVQLTEPSGRVLRTEVDDWGEVIRRTVGDPAAGHVLTLARQASAVWTGGDDEDLLDPVTGLVDGEGRTWSVSYDAGWRQTRLASPAAGAERMEYDLQGQATVRRWDDGSAESMTYDQAGRLAARVFAGPAQGASLAFEYDELGRVRSLTDPGLLEERSFEPGLGWDQIQWTARGDTPAEASFSLNRARLGHGLNDQVIGANRFVLHRGHDGRVERIEQAFTDDPQSLQDVLTVERDRSGRLTHVTRANGAVTRVEYDPLGRVVRQEEQAANGSVVLTWQWEADRPVQRSLDGLERIYSWDGFGRLAGCSDTGETYTWNKADERASADGVPCERDVAGRLSYDGTYDYSYDLLGRRTERVRRTDPQDRRAYEWGAGGRLIAVWSGPAGADSELVHFDYDGSGRVVARTDAAGTTRFAYLPDSERLVRVLAPDATEWHLVHAFAAAGYSVAVAADGRERYLHLDPFDRVLGVSDQDGVLTLLDEDCFGQRLSDPGLQGPDLGFHGMLFDPASGLYLAGARVYDPRVGEFLSPDPGGLAAAPAIYGYAGGNPVLAQDPGGRLAFVLMGAVMTGLVVLNEIRKFSQSDDVKRTRESYERMADVADDDSALQDSERAHENLSRASKHGGRTALKAVKKANDAVTNPAGSAKDLAEGASDLAESLLEDGSEGTPDAGRDVQ